MKEVDVILDLDDVLGETNVKNIEIATLSANTNPLDRLLVKVNEKIFKAETAKAIGSFLCFECKHFIL